ncbi:MAG: cysteine desulfurase-like protein [Acidobacteriota bacterium]
MLLDAERLRLRFPALQENYNGRPAVFFDNPGGTQTPRDVIEAIQDYLTRRNSNTHGAFETSRRTDVVIDGAHQAVADLLGAGADEIVFGPNMTSLTFQLSRSLAREFGPDDEIIVTRLDHDANVAPWLLMAEDTGAVVKWADIEPESCTLDMTDLKRQIGAQTKLIAVGYASNCTGSINDVAAISAWARETGAYLFVDAVQYAPHGLIDVKALGCDFLACSAYKVFGPHAGHLYGKRQHLERLKAYKVRPASNHLPCKWETGTQNHEGMAGVTAAIDYLAEIGEPERAQPRRQRLKAAWRRIGAYESGLCERLVSGLKAISGVRIYGITDADQLHHRLATVSIRKDGIEPRAMAEALAAQNIFVWDGNFYALSVTERLGLESSGGVLRIGLVHYNTPEEIDRCLDAIEGL